MSPRWMRSGFALVLSTAWAASPARAHLLPTQHGTINLRDSAAFVALSIPVSALRGWDADADGRMSREEFVQYQHLLRAQLDAGIVISSGADLGRRDLLQPSIDLADGEVSATAAGTHLLVLVRQSFTAVPHRIRLRLSLVGTASDERAFIISATDHGAPEVAVLTDADPAHEFFRVSHLDAVVGSVMRVLPDGSSASAWWLAACTVLVAAGVFLRRQRTAKEIR